ncbi:MAG: HPr(Ser) kinase/phosphatase [Candidatus Improbicoccus pseudotrichonymphae]|uniref:HPr kinase/phosphorylase n=1 Tax=Candidatus Improbicoccus pseudotrichonymphae TaxID=3033792 RepID=A0AA48HYC9_9FIRM|nr:MAG: HPr(Ser) kinase/phosphatase [Candidatus Improbicoccus pseudotrichonymphae]
MSKDFVFLKDVVENLSLKILFIPKTCNYEKIQIFSRHINRLGLDLIGKISEFDNERILIMGESEYLFLSRLNSEEIKKSIGAVFSLKPPALFIARGIKIQDEVIEMAESYCIPVFTTEDRTSEFISDLTEFLDEFLAPKITRSAGLISIHGEGVLIIGESGIGKSEIALELISRGHKFISDDVTEIKKISAKTILGFAPENVNDFIEVRGIGVINVKDLFGVNAIKRFERIDLVVNLEIWQNDSSKNRLGENNEEKYVEIFDVNIPFVSIPVKSGKNLAVIIEVAAMNNRLKKIGSNSNSEFMSKFGIPPKTSKEIKYIWGKD